MRRILLIVAIIAPILTFAAPARAGGWAATYLDPVPATFQPGATYTIGSWVLQHGNHPYSGQESELKVGLRFTDGTRTLNFDAVKLRVPAHYATAVSLPAGKWQVVGVQEWFAPHDLGTLTVPGALALKPLEPHVKQAAADYLSGNGGKDPWGAIRPPGIGKAAPGAQAAPATSPKDTAAPGAAAAAPGAAAPGSEVTSARLVDNDTPLWLTPYTLVAALVVAGALVVLLGVRRRRTHQKT